MVESSQEEKRHQVREDLSQLSYKPTQYADSSWELVGEFVNQTYFEASGFEVVSETTSVTDPMFADYGGIPKEKAKFRMHCPTGTQRAGKTAKQHEEDGAEEGQKKEAIAEEELARLIAEAETRGFEAGQSEFAKNAAAEKEALTNHYTSVMQDLAAQLKEKISEIEKKAVGFSVEMAEKLIGHAVEINPEYLLPIIQQALDLTGGATIKKIHVSREDFEFLKLISLEKRFPEYDGTWQFEADDTVKAGCIVETSAGEVNFDIQSAWDRVKDQVLKALV